MNHNFDIRLLFDEKHLTHNLFREKRIRMSKSENQSYSSFRTESEVSHSVTTTTAYPETTYTSNTYHQTLLRGFDELRQDAHLCDVTLIAGQAKYPVHRSLLAACSPYFRQMFTKDQASNNICRSEGSKYTWFSESIELRGISSEGLR